MNFLDMRTILISQIITDALCTLFLAFLWLQNRKRYAGITYWLLDFVFQTAGMLLVTLRGILPDWTSIVFSNTMVVTGALLGYMGLELFVGKKSSQKHNYLLLVVLAAVLSYFTFVKPDLAVRNLSISLALLIVCFQCVWLFLRRVELSQRRMTLGIGSIFGFFCLISLTRIVVILVSPHPSNDFFKSGFYDVSLLLSYQILLISLAFGLMIMVNQRFLRDIQAQEEKFSKAFRSSPYAITLTRLSDGKMIDVNDGFFTITGYSFGEAVGKTSLDLQLWASDADRASVVNELSKGKRITEKEFQFRKKSGEKMTGLFSAEIMLIDDQPWVLSSISDITERKRAEQALHEAHDLLELRVADRTFQLKAANLELERAARMKNEFLASMSHELRTPLTGILGLSEVMQMAGQDPLTEKQRSNLTHIHASGKRLFELINDILDLAKLETGKIDLNLAIFSLKEICQSSLRLIGPQASLKGLQSSFSMIPDCILLKADAHRLQQILLNLFGNAIKFTPQGGSFGVEILGDPSRNQVLITVWDTGIGIKENDIALLFQPFIQLDASLAREYSGTGLGLALVRKLTELHGGSVSVQSVPGHGSRFTVNLPWVE